jgi:hypothetical protein
MGGRPAPVGTTITALINGVRCGVGTTGAVQYALDISTITGCTTPGATVVFLIDGRSAPQTGRLPPVSTAVQVNLTVPWGPNGVPPPPPPPAPDGPPVALQPSVTVSAIGSAGQPTTVSGAVSNTPAGCSITQWTWSFGDGHMADGQSVTHSYASTGTFTVALSVYDSCGDSGTTTASIVVPGPVTISLGPGWQIVGGPTGSTVSGATGRLFTFQPGDTEYESFPVSTPLRGCWGYWAYFPNGGSITMPAATSPDPCTVSLADGPWAMVGNPATTGASTIVGASESYDYGGNGYFANVAVPVGGGAWVEGPGTVNVFPPGFLPPPPPPQ